MLIPKVINYIWLGDQNKKPIKRIDKWKSILKDWEFKQWDETNIDINKYAISKLAYEFGKFGVCMDTVKAEVLSQNGGVWLDTDVDVYEDLSDYLKYSLFAGYWANNIISLNTIGIVAHHPIMLKLLEWYEEHWTKCTIKKEDIRSSEFNTYYVNNLLPEPVLTRIMHSLYDFDFQLEGKTQIIQTDNGDICLEPTPVFSVRGNYGMKNYTQHLFEESWKIRPIGCFSMTKKMYENSVKNKENV